MARRRATGSAVARLGNGAFGLALLACACTSTLDAGHNRRGLLPVDQRNPVILYQDDWSGDWRGEYAVLFAAHGGQKLRYIQLSSYYDQSADVPASRPPSLPDNPLGVRIRDKQPNIIPITTAADQVALLAVALPAFVVAAQSVSPDVAAGFDATQGPRLLPGAGGKDLVVTAIAAQLAAPSLWEMLLDPQTFAP